MMTRIPEELHTAGGVSRRNALRWFALSPLAGLVARVQSVGRANEVERDADSPPEGDSLQKRSAAQAEEYVKAFNRHDLQRALSFFSENATVFVNGRRLQGRRALREFLVQYGATTEDPALAVARMVPEVSYFTGNALLVEGRIYGKQQGEISGFPGVGLNRSIAYASFYSFDDDGRCKKCEMTMNWGAFFGIV